ncbi:MAG: hypothetical protein HY823_02200 [Acidobacteria bacterium]|nr:hypothetical protein [Acidobacteriota bacterium]
MIRSGPLLLAALVAGGTLSMPLLAQKAGKGVSRQDEASLVWPPPPASARIKWVAEYRNEFDVGAKKRRGFLDRLAGKSEDVLWLKRPLSVAVDDKGVLYVGDFGLGVVGMDFAKKRMWTFASVSEKKLGVPSGLAVDSSRVFATDSNADLVAVFDKEGHFLMGLGSQDGISRPVGLAVEESRDLLLVVNGGKHEVLLYNRGLKLLKKIGSRGEAEGQFNFPTYATFVPGVGFAVADTGNFRIQLFDFNGKFLRAWGKVGDSPGTFARPKGIAVDPDNNLYVTDSTACNFQVLRLDGQPLTYVGFGGPGKGQFQVPNGIAIGKDGAIYIADQINFRIQRFQYLPAPKGPEGQSDQPKR